MIMKHEMRTRIFYLLLAGCLVTFIQLQTAVNCQRHRFIQGPGSQPHRFGFLQ